MALATSILWCRLVLGATGDLSASVQAHTGFDSNIFYASLTQFGDIAGQSRASDVFLSLSPDVAGYLQLGRWELGAQYALAATQFGTYAHGYTLLNHLALRQSVHLGPVWLTASESGDAYEVSAFRSDKLLRALGEVQALAVRGSQAVGVRLGAGPRLFPEREVAYQVHERDLSFVATALAHAAVGPLLLDGALSAEHRDSNAAALVGTLWTLQAGVRWALPRLEAALQAELRQLSFPDFPVSDTAVGRRDQQLRWVAAASTPLGPLLPGVEVSWEAGRSNYALGGFHRWTAGLTLALRWELGPRKARVGPGVTSAPEGRRRLRVHLPDGVTEVSLVGSFNGWRPSGLPFVRVAPGEWETVLDFPPGRFRCQLRVDGALRPLEDADGYAPDGLGGKDALILIPEASVPGINR